MNDLLRFPRETYRVENLILEGRSITFRAFRNLLYCSSPKDEIQKMNLFVPEGYYHGAWINGYHSGTAPIFLPNTVGGYMPGPADEPGIDSHTGKLNSIFCALEHGYVVASAGIRGRTTGKRATEFFEGSKEGSLGGDTGRMVGRAPALIVDYKAAIRYLRHNRGAFPGDTERIITNGTSAGGALSALAGATGNHADYEPWLREIGATEERDDVFAASCYCPIHNLEHADAAYEWLFCGLNDFHRTRHQRTETGVIRVPYDSVMTEAQIALSQPLKDLFPLYVNGLGLKTQDGSLLSLDETGEGSFKEYVKSFVVASADREWKTHEAVRKLAWRITPGSEIEKQDYLRIEDGDVTDLDWDGFVRKITRMKAAPAFDALDLSNPENEEFGDEMVEARHFSDFSTAHTTVPGAELASPDMIRMLNPTCYLGAPGADNAKHWRIRHGAFDRDTSLAIPVILATLLQNSGLEVDFRLPWGLPHSGDYDLDDLFAWVDSLMK